MMILTTKIFPFNGVPMFKKDKVLKYLKDNPGVCASDVSEIFNMTLSQASVFLGHLKIKGKAYCKQEKRGSNQVYAWYASGEIEEFRWPIRDTTRVTIYGRDE